MNLNETIMKIKRLIPFVAGIAPTRDQVEAGKDIEDLLDNLLIEMDKKDEQ